MLLNQRDNQQTKNLYRLGKVHCTEISRNAKQGWLLSSKEDEEHCLLNLMLRSNLVLCF